MALFRKNGSRTAQLRSGEKVPIFQLPSVQGGLFRLDMRTAHGPVVLAFVDDGEESRELLEQLKARERDFQRVGGLGAYDRPRPKRETQPAGGRPYSTIGPTMAATVAAVVRTETMKAARELQERLKLPYYILWDSAGQVSRMFGVPEGEIATAVVEMDRTLKWISEPDASARVEQILRAVTPEQKEDSDSGA